MKRLYITLAVVLAMAGLIPLAPYMAASVDSPFYTRLVYQAGHAGILHWLINGWSLLVLHNLLRPYRVGVAYTLSILITYLPLPLTPHPSPLIGASVITCFFFGFLAPHLWYRGERLSAAMMLALILIGFFIPGIAAAPHLAMFLSGLAWYYIEREYRSFRYFISH